MSSENIYTILSSKPHNVHYLRRYYNFILACSQANSGKTKEELGYTEKHHICPKADDMFPEYKNFSKFVWNEAILTGRQHFIAHWMLWKAYGGSQTRAFWMMKNNSINSTSYQLLRIEVAINISTKLKERGYTEEERMKVSLRRKGTVASDETKKKMSERRKGKPKSEDHRKKMSEKAKLILTHADKTKYRFENIKTKEIVEFTRCDFAKYIEKTPTQVTELFRTNRIVHSAHGWRLIGKS